MSPPAAPGPPEALDVLRGAWAQASTDECLADAEALDRALRAAHLAALSIADYRVSLPAGEHTAALRHRAELVGQAIDAVVSEIHRLSLWHQVDLPSGSRALD